VRVARATLCPLLALAIVAGAGCTQRHLADDGLYECPLLRVPGGTYGGLASVGRFPAGACVELFLGEERLARTYVGAGGALALQFLAPGALPDGVELELRVGTTPLIASGARLVFRGSLEPEGAASPLAGVVLVNWTRGGVSTISPRPAFSTTFTASIAGNRGDCGAVIARHTSGAPGGCWWPRGGGGCAPVCTEEEYRRGACPIGGSGFCGRGCAVIEVDERTSGIGPPETDRSTPVLPPPPDPLDAGPPPDVGPPDAPLEDALPIETGPF
jgi:hypothetical protein